MSKKKSIIGTVIIRFFDDKTCEAGIRNFERLTPSMIDRGNDAAQALWNKYRSQAVMQPKADLAKAKKAQKEVENAEG